MGRRCVIRDRNQNQEIGFLLKYRDRYAMNMQMQILRGKPRAKARKRKANTRANRRKKDKVEKTKIMGYLSVVPDLIDV